MIPPAPEDHYGAFDDTVDDESVEAPSTDAQPWLTQQRFVHGMLRALNTADANARQARIASVMTNLRSQRVRFRRRLVAAAAAVILGAAVTWVVATIDHLPKAEAMVAKALASLQQPVDRAFELRVELDRNGRRTERTLQFVMRPGSRFLISGEATFGAFKAGCDGEVVWFEPAIGAFRSSVPLTEAHKLTDRLGDVLDLGYLDLETLLRRLPQDTELRCVGREARGIRVEAIGTLRLRHLELQSIRMLVDDRTGLLHDIEANVVSERRDKKVDVHLRYRHLGDRDLGDQAYRRPW